MDGYTVWIVVAVALAIVTACGISGLLWCVLRACKKSKRTRKEIDLEKDGIPEGEGVTVLIMDDDELVAKKAFQDSGNVLWTNEGKVFSTKCHPEEQFLSTNSDPRQITEIYIKNSPCSACSAKLITHFAQCQPKPTIFIGKISHLRDSTHKKGMQQLLKNGFNIQVWQALHDLMFSTRTTEKYIEQLKK